MSWSSESRCPCVFCNDTDIILPVMAATNNLPLLLGIMKYSLVCVLLNLFNKVTQWRLWRWLIYIDRMITFWFGLLCIKGCNYIILKEENRMTVLLSLIMVTQGVTIKVAPTVSYDAYDANDAFLTIVYCYMIGMFAFRFLG